MRPGTGHGLTLKSARGTGVPDAQKNTGPAAVFFSVRLRPYFPCKGAFGRMNYTFSGFSKAGNAVVRGAIAAAQDMGHTYVGTEHLLLALVRDDTGEAAAFLLERQVYGYQVGRLLREQVGCGRRTRLSPRDFTPALSKCVDCAVIEAKAVSDGKVEPVHLLAALLEAPATAGRILVQLGVEPAAAAKECGRRMGKFPLFQQTPRPVTSPRARRAPPKNTART